MKWLDRLLIVYDNLPPGEVDAIFCPSYCLTRNGMDLTIMNRCCILRVTDMVSRYNNPRVIFSNAYEEFSEKEIELRKKILEQFRVDMKNVWLIAPVVSTYDEVNQLRLAVKSFRIRSLLVVAEAYHMKRVLAVIRHFIPEVEVFWTSVECPKFEATAEPSNIKSFRISNETLWIVWNVICNLASPVLLRRK